jgi:hypothetical protein
LSQAERISVTAGDSLASALRGIATEPVNIKPSASRRVVMCIVL